MMLSLLLSRPALMAAAFMVGVTYGWVQFNQKADIIRLQGELIATQTDLKAAHAAAASAIQAEVTLRELIDDNQQKLEAYEKALTPGACVLSIDDAERLRQLGGRR